MAGYTRAGTAESDLAAWYSGYGMTLLPGSRVFLQTGTHVAASADSVVTNPPMPAIVKSARRLAGSSAWYAVQYQCVQLTSFADQFQVGRGTVWVMPAPQLGGGAFISSVVNPTAGFFTLLDSFLSVMQIFLAGDWGAILEYLDAGLRYRGFSFVLAILVFGRTVLLSTYTAFVIAWIARSAFPTVLQPFATRAGPGPSAAAGLGQQDPKARADNAQLGGRLDGIWRVRFQDNSVAMSPVIVRHISDGMLTLRSKIFPKNPVKASVDAAILSVTIQRKGRGSTTGRLQGLACIEWDHGQIWEKDESHEAARLAGLASLPDALDMQRPQLQAAGDAAEPPPLLERFPRMAHAASTHSAMADDPTQILTWPRSPCLEGAAFWCISNVCPIQNRALYDFFDTIQVPWIRYSALKAALGRARAWCGATYTQRAQRAQLMYKTIQELRRNKDAQNVLDVDLASLTVPQLEAIFEDRKQKIRIQQKVEMYLVTVIEQLLQRREALQSARLEYTLKERRSSAWHDAQIEQLGVHIARLEDIKTMLPYDLRSCLVFSRTSGARKSARRIAKSAGFNAFIFACIVLNVLTQSFDSPYLPGPAKAPPCAPIAPPRGPPVLFAACWLIVQ